MLGISGKCALNQFIAKKNFYTYADMTSADKTIFTDNIAKITLIYQMHTKNMNIAPYMTSEREYPMINIMEVALDKVEKLKRIAEIIMRSIPYPMVLIFVFEEKYQVWTAHQRVNQNDETKNVLEDFVFTEWIDNLDFIDIGTMNMANFYTLYSDIVDCISIHNAKNIVNDTDITGEQARAITAEVQAIDAEITALKAKMKKETQFNKRIEMNIQIKKLEQKRKQIAGC